MEFNILGPLEVWADGQQLALGGPRQRVLLAMLLLAGGRVVPVDTLVEAVWGDDAPPTSRTQIAICVASLRKTFRRAGCPDGAILTAAPGYRLLTAGHRFDATTFTRQVELADGAAHEGRTAEAVDLLDAALRLWRGAPMAGVSSYFVESGAMLLEERRLSAYEHFVGLKLELGRHRQVIPELAQFVREHPLREHARAALMLAQYRAGCRAEALELFRQGRTIMARELGLEPGRALQELHEGILREDPVLSLVGGARQPAASVAGPPDVDAERAFIGRRPQLAQLDQLLRPAPDGSAGARTAVVSGRRGVGKSALVQHWARSLAPSFPDGVLIGRAAPRGAAGSRCGALLREFGVPDHWMPSAELQRARLLRELLEDRQALVVLEDVETLAAVEELLPHRGGSRVVVVTRHRPGVHGGLDVPVPGFGLAEVDELLSDARPVRAAGPERAARQRLITLCEGLPLSLTAAAARLAAKPSWNLADLVQQLEDPRDRLEELSRGDGRVRQHLDEGYGALSPAARTLYRRMELLSDGNVLVRTAAALLDTGSADAENVVRELVEAQVLDFLGFEPDRVSRSGEVARYRAGGLLQAHARERGQADDRPDERRRAWERLQAAQRRADDGCEVPERCGACQMSVPAPLATGTE